MAANNEVFVTGTCLKMCPASEVRMRERHGLLHRFEMVTGTETFKRPRVDRNKAVKEYSRPAAGKQDPSPSDLRPGHILLYSTQYLIDSVCSMENVDWIKKYEFVFDRLRAIRQDMVIQNLNDNYIVKVLECCVRFHIYSSYKLCDITPGSGMYDDKINSTHTQECLKRLLCLYEIEGNCRCNQHEFLALYLLFNLCSTDALQLALEHKNGSGNIHSDFHTALYLSCAWLRTNYARVFKYAVDLSPLAVCALHVHINAIRYQGLKVMSSAYSSKNLGYSLKDLSTLLQMSQSECQELCEKCGLEAKESGLVIFNKALFKSNISLVRSHSDWIDERLEDITVSGLLKGKPCTCSYSR